MRLDPDNRALGSPEWTAAAPPTGFNARKQTRPADSGQHHRTALRRLPALVRTSARLLGFALVSLAMLTQAVQAKGGVGGGVVPGATPLSVGPATLPGGPAPFDIVGAIQSFSVITPNNLFSGGMIVVNGISVVIPTNLVVTLPAAYKTVGQLFIESPVAGQSALALIDLPAPIAAYEATIAGNIVNGAYIAGLVSISQQSLNTANGYIRSINYSTGELCVGRTPGTLCDLTDARVVINDPDGRYGLANGTVAGALGKAKLDARFTVDADNPTIHARSGYPMCVPRVDPLNGVDPRCPIGNRPTVLGAYVPLFVMDSIPQTPPLIFAGRVGTIPPCGIVTATNCNVNEQAPLVVGDYIAYSGILARDISGPGIYVAAYSLEANVGIYTPLGGPVFYMYVDAPLISTGPAACPANAECQARLKTSIFMTDASRTPALYAVDENLLGGRTSRVLPSTITNTAFYGRFVIVVNKDVAVLGAANGVTREIMGRVAGVPDGTPVFYGPAPLKAVSGTANGLVFGQYVSPVGEYIFPEPNVAGGILTPYNFRCLAFLAKGWAQGGVLSVGQPVPFPEAQVPSTVNCGT